MFSLYLFQGLKFLVYDLPKERKIAAAKLAELEKLDEELQLEIEEQIILKHHSSPTNMQAIEEASEDTASI